MTLLGGVVLLFFLCLLCMMMRKRRARAQYARSHPGAPIPGNLNGWTPGAVGAPFSRFGSGGQRDPYPPQGGPQTSNYENQNPPVSTPHTSMTNNNPEYPPPSAPPPPPAYGKDANYGGNYNPVSVSHLCHLWCLHAPSSPPVLLIRVKMQRYVYFIVFSHPSVL